MAEVLIHENSFDKARKLIRQNRDKEIIFSSDDDELNRKVPEKEKIDALLINQSARKDFQKQRNSGLNQVMAKSAQKKNVSIGINLDEIILSNSLIRAQVLARIKQNIKICSKNKLKMKFISLKKENERNIYDLKSLGLVLGMSTLMIKSL